MVSLDDYLNREQAYVKHIFLERYLEALFHKTGSTYNHIVYVDGFAGRDTVGVSRIGSETRWHTLITQRRRRRTTQRHALSARLKLPKICCAFVSASAATTR